MFIQILKNSKLSPLKCLLWAMLIAFHSLSSAASLRPMSLEDQEVFRTLNRRFRELAMQSDVKKIVKVALLDQERKSEGDFKLQKGRVRMELKGDENSLLVINSKKLYAVTFPASGLKSARTQVIEADLKKNPQVKTQGLLLLLASGKFETVFNITGVLEPSKDEMVFFMTPKKPGLGLKRAQMMVTPDGHYLRELKYWDELDNEILYQFSSHKKQDKIEWKYFEYQPPADAEIINER